jgi:hypothetical protein
MMINCKESAIRSSELRDRQIKGIRRFELWFHITICKVCKAYHKQVKFIGKLSNMMGECGCSDKAPEGLIDARLSDDAKSRIKEKLAIK